MRNLQKQPFVQRLFKIGVLQNFAISTGKHLCWSLFLNFIKKRLQHRRFPVNIAKFLRTAFSIEHLVAASELSSGPSTKILTSSSTKSFLTVYLYIKI